MLHSMQGMVQFAHDKCQRDAMLPHEGYWRHILTCELHLGWKNLRFDRFLLEAQQHGLLRIEGTAPDRLLWPPGQRDRVAYVDPTRPCARLSAEDDRALLEFLALARPRSIPQGRFGFANWLAERAPARVRRLPFGYLVELTQVLLNRRVLVYRKGCIGHNSAEISPAIAAQETWFRRLQLKLQLVHHFDRSAAVVGLEETTATEEANFDALTKPLCHFEHVGPADSPTWRCVVSFHLQGRWYSTRSPERACHASCTKEAAQEEACRGAMAVVEYRRSLPSCQTEPGAPPPPPPPVAPHHWRVSSDSPSLALMRRLLALASPALVLVQSPVDGGGGKAPSSSSSSSSSSPCWWSASVHVKCVNTRTGEQAAADMPTSHHISCRSLEASPSPHDRACAIARVLLRKLDAKIGPR